MTGSILDRPTSTSDRPDVAPDEQAHRDSECVAFFVTLVTAAVVMLGLSLFTGVEGLLRLALTAGAGLLAGALAWATARPVLEDDATGD